MPNDTSPSSTDLARPAVLNSVGLPKQLETIDGNVRPAETTAAATLVDSAVYAQASAKEWSDAVIDAKGRKRLVSSLRKILRISRLYFTGGLPVPSEGRPQNWALVPPASDSMLKATPLIKEDARYVLRGIPLPEAAEVRELLADLYEAREATIAYNGDIDAMIASGENFLNRVVRVFDHRVTSLVEEDREVASLLRPINTLVRGDSQRAQRTKSLKDRVTNDTVADIEARLAEEKAAASKIAPSPNTPPIVSAPPAPQAITAPSKKSRRAPK